MFSIIVNILAVIGLIIIISYIIYYIFNYIKNKNQKAIVKKINPPPSYMQNTGLKCPDYWVNTGIDDNGNFICKNSFNIETNNPKTGKFANKCNSEEMAFTPVDDGFTWDYNNPNLKTLDDADKYSFLATSAVSNSLSRCDWINNCGPSNNIQGVWTGVNEVCNNPPENNSKKNKK